MILGYAVKSRTFDACAEVDDLALVKDYLRVTHLFDDLTVIPTAIEAALEYCESCGNVSYLETEIEAIFTEIGPDGVLLPMTALREIISVEENVDNVFQVLDADQYSYSQLGTETTAARLYLTSPDSTNQGTLPKYRVTYSAGLSDTLTGLSGRLKMGILTAVNHFYAHRNEQNPDKTIPRSVADLVTIKRNPVL